MHFSREELSVLSNPRIANQERVSQVGSALLKKIHEDCGSLSSSEKLWICKMLQILRVGNDRLDPFDFPCCEDVLFQIRYILYFNNVEGWYPAFDWDGQISGMKRGRDLVLLENSYREWSTLIQITNHRNSLLQNVSVETRHHLRLIERYCRSFFIGANRLKYLKKSLTLHSKYLFGIVKGFYEENPVKQYILIDGNSVFIDSFFFIHTIFRHYGQILKEYQAGKTYHEEGLDYKNLPLEVLRILEAYSHLSEGNFDGQKIYFDFSDMTFAIWMRKIRVNMSPEVFNEEFRVQTLYPVESINELEKIRVNYSKKVEYDIYQFYL